MDDLFECLVEICIFLFEELAVPMMELTVFCLRGIFYPFVWIWRKIKRGYQWISGSENA